MDFPEVVYAPAYPDPRPGNRGVRLETRRLDDGQIVGIAFRDRGSLVGTLGPAQPWLAIRLDRLGDLLGGAGVRRILVDPPTVGRWTAERVELLAEVLEDSRG
jgi:hypothetical protein